MPTKRLPWLIDLIMGVAFLSACTAGSSTPGPAQVPVNTPTQPPALTATRPAATETLTPQPAPTKETEPMPDHPSPTPVQDSYEAKLIETAKADLSQRLDIQVDEIELVEFRYMTWPDAALGCPKPGMLYTQVMQEGYLIILKTTQGVFNYHGGGYPDRGPFLCEQ